MPKPKHHQRSSGGRGERVTHGSGSGPGRSVGAGGGKYTDKKTGRRVGRTSKETGAEGDETSLCCENLNLEDKLSLEDEEEETGSGSGSEESSSDEEEDPLARAEALSKIGKN